ncbi:MAG: glycosyltransferase family 4 protein [Bacilli bacterium]|nr:glycosyltransferase family 4 protein [Bacilli bacterium]
MKILVVSQQYWPETWRIVDTCERLVKDGNEVTVLCGLPNNDDGTLKKEYKDKSLWKQDRNGVKIIRVNEHPRNHGALNLYLKYKTYQRNATSLAKKLPGDFDVVLVNQLSPVMQSDPAIAYARKHNKKILMYCLDLWPESLSVGGVVERGITKPIYRHYLKVSKKIYHSMDKILVTSPKYIDYLNEVCGVDKDKMGFLPQYGEELFQKKVEPKLDETREHNFVFAGNVGKAQDLQTLVKAASMLKERQDIAIHIVGSGSALQAVKDLAEKEGTSNVIFHGRIPLEEIPSVYAASDALLVNFAKGRLTSYVLPAKLQSYMAAGKPIVGCADGAVPHIIEEAKCGLCVNAGDHEALAKVITEIADADASTKEKYGKNAQEFSQAFFDPDKYFSVLESELKKLSD